MTVQELAKMLNMHLGQGRAQYQITMFHCPDVAHGAEPVTALIEREGTQTLEFYSGTGVQHPPEDDMDDLI